MDQQSGRCRGVTLATCSTILNSFSTTSCEAQVTGWNTYCIRVDQLIESGDFNTPHPNHFVLRLHCFASGNNGRAQESAHHALYARKSTRIQVGQSHVHRVQGPAREGQKMGDGRAIKPVDLRSRWRRNLCASLKLPPAHPGHPCGAVPSSGWKGVTSPRVVCCQTPSVVQESRYDFSCSSPASRYQAV